MLVIRMLVYEVSGMLSVIRKFWNGLRKFVVKNIMKIVLIVRIMLLIVVVEGCGMWILRLSRVSLEE